MISTVNHGNLWLSLVAWIALLSQQAEIKIPYIPKALPPEYEHRLVEYYQPSTKHCCVRVSGLIDIGLPRTMKWTDFSKCYLPRRVEKGGPPKNQSLSSREK
jgi:hypothetical protein